MSDEKRCDDCSFALEGQIPVKTEDLEFLAECVRMIQQDQGALPAAARVYWARCLNDAHTRLMAYVEA